MAKRREAKDESTLGDAILQSLCDILQRCAEAGHRLGYPGEGGERSFRGWLVTDLLASVLGWPTEAIVVGERFDILLQDAEGFPIVTIETKTPYHKASRKERDDFEARLSGFGTLRHAFFTNGAQWERLDIFSPTGALDILSRFSLDVDQTSPEEVEAFFAPLAGDRYLRATPRAARHAVTRDNPHILEALAADLDQTIGDFTFLFEFRFAGLREGRCGQQPGRIALALFDLWCDKSLVISPRQAGERLADLLSQGDWQRSEIAKAIGALGFSGAEATAAADGMATLPQPSRTDLAALADALWPAYGSTAKKLCAQTAHVMLARTLLYRIGEDQGLFPRLLSGEGMERALSTQAPAVVDAPKAATDLLLRVQDSMRRFLPAVYELGEFDWWQVRGDKRATLAAQERGWLRPVDDQLERAAQRLLRVLNGYFFGRVDVDVWRNVYQHYLPHEERQKLGGFYTPDELVDLVLDLAQYVPGSEGLCRLSLIDPACGSGAFVTGALSRLLKHMELDLPCHGDLHRRGTPKWKQAEAILNLVSQNLHAVDLHPFAAFLTTVNVLFLLMPLYIKVREKNPDYSLDLQVFSADSLEKHDRELLTPDLFSKLNARVQLSEESFHRYQEMLTKRFDRVFGNPPWGGVLKGALAPVYDELKKSRFADEYPAAAQGKYDVYGLFVERALQLLNPGGRFGLVTQGTFMDKGWAAGLRRLLTSKSRLRYVVDLNPFGQLFFHAMNSPCITVADATGEFDRREECLVVLSDPPTDFAGLSAEQRRERVVATVREALHRVSARRKNATVGFARAARVQLNRLAETSQDRWHLAAADVITTAPEGWWRVADLLEIRQGVTPGGCLDVFLMSEEQSKALGLEPAIVHRAIKSKEIDRWRVSWAGRVLLYPYCLDQEETTPAFGLKHVHPADTRLADAIRRLGISDALDFDTQLDDHEREVVRRKGVHQGTVAELLKHRIALGLVKYPSAARYLVQHYERLEGRVFEKKRFTRTGKQWYEYHRPRDPKLMLSRTRIVSPTLVKRTRFSLDTVGYLSDHACLYLQPTHKTHRGHQSLRKQLSEATGRPAPLASGLKYCLAFLNSAYANDRLRSGRLATPKGFYGITEDYLREVPIPPPRKGTALTILEIVTRLMEPQTESEIARLEEQVNKIASALLKAT